MNLFFPENPTPGLLRDSQNIDNTLGKIVGIDGSIDTASDSTKRLSISFYVLIAWVVLVTASLVAVVLVTCRQWRKSRSQSFGGQGSVRGASSQSDFEASKSDIDGVSVGHHDSIGDGLDSSSAIGVEDRGATNAPSSSPAADGITVDISAEP